MDLDKIWNVVKDVKLESSETNLQCGFSSKGLSGFYEDSYIASQVKMVENKLSIESSEKRFENMTLGQLKTAAEMFTYLSYCTRYSSWEKEFLSWFRLYDDLFQTQSAYKILLTLNRMSHIKRPENKFGKVSARKLLSKAASLFTQFIKEDILLTSLPENETVNYASAMKGKIFII